MNLMMGAAFLGSLYRYADDDVNTWIREVEVRDGQTLEWEITDAMNTLVTGIKADGDWASINTLVVLNAAHTLSGMSVAVKGSNVGTLTNISSGDLVRGRGLTGNGVDKRADTTVPLNSYGSTISGFIGAHISTWSANSPNTLNQFAIGPAPSRMGIGGATVTPTSTDSLIVTQMWSSGSFFGSTIGGSGFGSNIVMSACRTGGNLTTKTYSPTPTNTTTAASTSSTPGTTPHQILSNNSSQFILGTLASYVMSNGSQAAADRVMPRLATFTATLRTFFGN
jgi:hypothetical protein